MRRLGLLVAALLCGCGGSDGPSSSGAGPTAGASVHGVLLVVCDTLRADRLDPYGGDVGTPHVNRLAERGVVWEQNRAQGCWTLPSMISMMTGRWISERSRGVPKDQPTLADLLSEEGFRTGAFVANAVASPQRGFARSVDHFDQLTYSDPADVVAKRFLDWKAGLDLQDERPWFGWVHFMDPHMPYEPDERFLRPQAPVSSAQRDAWKRAEYEIEQFLPGSAAARQGTNGRQFIRGIRQAYDGEVRSFDHGLGLILDALEASGELDTTLVVLAADHGEAMFENPIYPGEKDALLDDEPRSLALGRWLAYDHKHWYFPQTWNTPLIVSGPGFERGVVGEGMSANIDILPTILAAVGAHVPDDLDGTSLVGRTTVERELVFGHGRDTTAVIDGAGNFWVEMPRELSGVRDPQRPSGLLFQLSQGPLYLTDRSRQEPELAASLRQRIDEWRATTTLRTNLDVDDSADQILIDLGYVEGPAGDESEDADGADADGTSKPPKSDG
ncbi:sulfatase [Rohdeia mirabilis]|uniref:sulfatase n=1 Tax=Rohdeia mirabilis TaxID=2528008 RepID=UPI003AF39A5F